MNEEKKAGEESTIKTVKGKPIIKESGEKVNLLKEKAAAKQGRAEQKKVKRADASKEQQPKEPKKPAEITWRDDRDQVRAGVIVSVYEKVIDITPKGEKRERVQIFKGMVLARKHGQEAGATITVRKQSGDVSVEKILPVYSPLIERIVIEKIFKTRRAKLYFLRRSKERLREVK